MANETTQSEFHVMRGHVIDGMKIHMENGDTLTLRGSMNGWVVDGPNASVEMASANEVEHYIATY